jgi:hypothetical protein
MEEDILFVFIKKFYYHLEMIPNGASCRTLGTIRKLLMSRGASRRFHNDLTYNEKVIEY